MSARQRAFVTGARRGIGKAIALALAGAGFDVAVNDVADNEELRATVGEISACGVKSIGVVGDISDLASHKAMLEKAEAVLGSLTTLVNNAGVSVQSRGDLLDVSPESYDRCLNVNTRGTFFLPRLLRNGLSLQRAIAAL